MEHDSVLEDITAVISSDGIMTEISIASQRAVY
jgi:hypothetical protein